ncbi:MAG: TIGR04150 pseudo-rSAM protein [Candidatus Aminicenantes bacterium]|nr:TIGR04150 pseudo-rSAM protein [Candidatus Aminicenantes bacterium]
MTKYYWFYLDSYVHAVVKKGIALVYNPLNGQSIEEENPIIVNLVKKLVSKKNLLVVKLSGKELKNPDISAFVKKVREQFSGDLIDASYLPTKPVQMLPLVKVQKDVDQVKAGGKEEMSESIMDYLTEISLYINNRCSRDCAFCKNGYKQFLTCTRNGKRSIQELEIETVERFLNEAQGSALHRLNILGGDFFSYSRFEELARFLNDYKRLKTYHSHYLNLPGRKHELQLIKDDRSSLAITIDFPAAEDKLKEALDLLAETGMPAEFVFVVRQEKDATAAQAISARFKITEFTFKPYYDGDNFDFFKDNVFVNKQELVQLKPGLKQIFPRVKTNPLNFGKITVLSNNAIYANVNANIIGRLGSESLYDTVLSELFDGSSWRKSRDKVNPCRSCVYCFLCPPLTNYEYALKRNNLCHIWQQSTK